MAVDMTQTNGMPATGDTDIEVPDLRAFGFSPLTLIRLKEQGLTPREIRAAIDAKYAAQMDLATPTPYPPRD